MFNNILNRIYTVSKFNLVASKPRSSLRGIVKFWENPTRFHGMHYIPLLSDLVHKASAQYLISVKDDTLTSRK